jgi:hypothetical protein
MAAPIVQTVAAVVSPMSGAIEKGKQDMAEITNGSDRITNGSDRITNGSGRITNGLESIFALGQGNIEAVMRAGQIWTAGLQDLSKLMAANTQATFDETAAIFKEIKGVNSLGDTTELLTKVARVTVEKSMVSTTELASASLKLAEQTLAPITARMQVGAQAFAIKA